MKNIGIMGIIVGIIGGLGLGLMLGSEFTGMNSPLIGAGLVVISIIVMIVQTLRNKKIN